MGPARVEAMAAVAGARGRPGGGGFMKRHGLTLVLALTLVLVTVPSTWFAWVEFTQNEQAGVHAHHPSGLFWAYVSMQVGLNVVAEIIGLLIMTTYTKRLYEQGSAESK